MRAAGADKTKTKGRRRQHTVEDVILRSPSPTPVPPTSCAYPVWFGAEIHVLTGTGPARLEQLPHLQVHQTRGLVQVPCDPLHPDEATTLDLLLQQPVIHPQ